MSEKVSLMLSGPVKIDGRIRPVGAVVPVDPDTAAELLSAGVATVVLATAAAAGRVYTEAEWSAAVAAEAHALAGQAFDGALNQLEAEAKEMIASIDKLEAEKVAAVQRADTAEAQVVVLEERVLELQKTLGESTERTADQINDTSTDTPPTERAAKTTPKKGAAAATKA